MPWLELSLVIAAAQQQRIESALEDVGALSITLQDADADTPDERAIFEPGVGETPVWHELALQALFSAGTDRAGLLAALGELVPDMSPERIDFRVIEDQDWTRAWMDRFQPMRFGARLWIYPHDADATHAPADAVIVRLDPGLAFGTGTHPTTALCLEWLDAADLAGATLIDYGCGSGVLAIAALKLGAARVLAVDNDAQALAATADNAERNGVRSLVELYTPDALPPQPADALVANILAGPLFDLAPRFAGLVRSGGALVLSGILDAQHQELLARYGQWFDALQAAGRDGWVRIAGRRHGR